MNNEEYMGNLSALIKEEHKKIISNNHSSLLVGYAGKALFELNEYLRDKSPIKLLKVKKSLSIALNNIHKTMEDTSFFTGTLGVVWVCLLTQENTHKKVLKEEDLEKILRKYFFTQEQKLKEQTSVLDYLYGVTGWFIIYPYLSTSFQKVIIAIFEEQLNFFDEVNIYSHSRKDAQDHFTSQQNLLGFAHGLSSIATIIEQYPINNKYNELARSINKKIENSLDDDGRIPRKYGGDDYVRQQWCHGSLGSLLVQTNANQEKILSHYFTNKEIFPTPGVCHGLAHKVLLSKICLKLFNFKTQVEVDFHQIEQMRTKDIMYFISSFQIAKMALDFDLDKHHNFSWWRICYPINRKNLENH